jgi:histidinol-phosphatase (PHP family)
MINFDYHTHSKLSDGANTHEEMVLSAIDKGLDEIGFSDHFCIKYSVPWAVGAIGIAKLEEKVFQMKEKFGNRINVLFGIEVDYFPELEKEIGEVLNRFNFDYVIGSIHFLDEWNYDTDKSRYPEFANDYLYEWYFGELQKAVKSELFDYMAHPDLIKKHRIWPETSMKSLYREVAKTFAECGVAYEVNTSGRDRPCGEFFPSRELINELYEAGVPVTLGSDSHNSDQIGRYFNEAKTLLKDVGYQSLIRFSKRKQVIEAF